MHCSTAHEYTLIPIFEFKSLDRCVHSGVQRGAARDKERPGEGGGGADPQGCARGIVTRQGLTGPAVCETSARRGSGPPPGMSVPPPDSTGRDLCHARRGIPTPVSHPSSDPPSRHEQHGSLPSATLPTRDERFCARLFMPTYASLPARQHTPRIGASAHPRSPQPLRTRARKDARVESSVPNVIGRLLSTPTSVICVPNTSEKSSVKLMQNRVFSAKCFIPDTPPSPPLRCTAMCRPRQRAPPAQPLPPPCHPTPAPHLQTLRRPGRPPSPASPPPTPAAPTQ